MRYFFSTNPQRGSLFWLWRYFLTSYVLAVCHRHVRFAMKGRARDDSG